MRCQNCRNLCADGDTTCAICHNTLVRWGYKPSLVFTCTSLFLIVGIAVHNVMYPIRGRMTGEDLMWAAIFGLGSATLGLMIGLLLGLGKMK